jgi:heme/copper-type cytochrome/quinol oxidase subunit 2
MPKAARLALALGIFVVAVALAVIGAMAYLRSNPPNVDYAAGHQSGQPVHLTIQTVGQIGFGAHPSWVSYLALAPDGRWVHSTLWQLPAHTLVDVTVYEYDTGGPLRNQVFGSVSGVIGDDYVLNGKPVRLLDSNSGNGVAHTFSVPALGINVPLWGVPSSAKNICAHAPCSFSSVHNVITFSFRTPGPGQYHWQCLIPCGAGFLDGNGGPMQSIGYMGGFLKVVDA